MTRCIPNAALSVLLVATVSSVAIGQAPPPPATEVGAAMLALVNVPAKDGATLTVTTPAFANGGDIPFENTAWRTNIFPGLAWSRGPSGTMSYAVIMQDGDAVRDGAPILHWTMAGVPASVTKLDAAMSAPPVGAQYGPNIRGPVHAYMGPRTPAGPKHRYHLQVFALDKTFVPDSTTTYASMTDAMKGHVLASGQVIGLGQMAPPAP
jgi:para-nitrobenzyl esterase